VRQPLVLQVERFVERPRQVVLLVLEQHPDRPHQQLARDGRDGVQVDDGVVVEAVAPACEG